MNREHEDPIDFCSTKEMKSYVSMKEELISKGEVKGSHIRKLLVHLVNNRASYSKSLNFCGYLKQVISGLMPCSCCCKRAKAKAKLFEHGTE